MWRQRRRQGEAGPRRLGDSGAGPVTHAALEVVGVVLGRVRPPAVPTLRRGETEARRSEWPS